MPCEMQKKTNTPIGMPHTLYWYKYIDTPVMYLCDATPADMTAQAQARGSGSERNPLSVLTEFLPIFSLY